MMTSIPYGGGSLSCTIKADSVLTSRIGSMKRGKSGSALVQEAMSHPIGSPQLTQLASGKANATVIISDHTPPVGEILRAVILFTKNTKRY